MEELSVAGVDCVETGKSTGPKLDFARSDKGQALRRFGNRTTLASLARRAGGYLKGGARRRIRLEGD